MNLELVYMSQRNSLIFIIICLLLGFMIGRYILPKETEVSIIDYNEEYYTTQIQKSLSTIDSLESIIKTQESIVDSFLNLKDKVRVEYIIKREEIKNLPIDSSVQVLKNFIKDYEEDLSNNLNYIEYYD